MMSKQDQASAGPGCAPFVLHVVWHPDGVVARDIAEDLRCHFASDRYRDIAGGAGVTVLLRDANAPNSPAPPAIDWADGEIVAVVALVDKATVDDPRWAPYLDNIIQEAEERGYTKRVFPVTLDDDSPEDFKVQALRWDCWSEGGEGRHRTLRLIRELTHQFTRMLRLWLRDQRGHSAEALQIFGESIQVFLSHSKHDERGEAIAKSIRQWLNDHSALGSFLDVNDMMAGVQFGTTIDDAIRHGVLVAIYTDSYSSREWCRREAILAKRHGVPMLVVDCLQNKDDRAFPYLWNVPVIRMDPGRPEQTELVVSTLLDEVFKDFLWRQRIDEHRPKSSRTVFTPRPPELTTAAVIDNPTDDEWTIVHPDPPLGWEERRLFMDILPKVRVCTLSEWLAGG